jgi:hypothetical protein
MTVPEDHTTISQEEIAHLAYLNWQKDGCPHGRDQNYWLEAERQMKATRHLLALDVKPVASQAPAAIKSRSTKARKKSTSQ